MIYESYPWKQDLLYRKRLFLTYNTSEHFKKDDKRTFTVLEKVIFYSAFIIRKLIDCHVKTSDEADKYILQVEKRIPLKSIDLLHQCLDENMYDWGSVQKENTKGKDICNWLIHSYVFFFSQKEDETIDGFFVSSDYDKNKALYYIPINDWLNYMDFIGKDGVVGLTMHYNEKEKDFRLILKERN